ncbi:IclR family transcriptional regulator [Comamonas thiooxydans]|uniref:IclR family transcriptional regulator n=2 Tax=Comamonas thiooxydans TaxID=363952 RepID=A0A0E3BXI7_9BURK|nr:IclR family transcriptional regulator [Comamonas thiooxydans]KGH12766.1 IclR family transcriptional regulator [Comamonas thiooxydans]
MGETEKSMSASNGEGTGALEKALDVLEAIGFSADGISQSDLAAQLRLPRTTVYRLLATLVARGLVRRDPQRKIYRLGFRCFEMARNAYLVPDLASAAVMELRALRDITGETTYLATLDGREVISLERCDGAHSQRSAAALGQRKPIHCTSQGKAILSAMSDEMRNELIRDVTLKELTPLTITDRRRLQAEIRITKSRGYAIDDEEIVLGVRCVGAPIVDSAGQVRGAVSVAGPAWRLTRARLELLGPEVADAARRIGAQLQPTNLGKPESSETQVQAISAPWAFHGAHPVVAMSHGVFWADALAPSVRVLQGSSDLTVVQFLPSPIMGLVVQSDTLLVVTESEVASYQFNGEKLTVRPWPHGITQAVCGGLGNTVWASMALPEGGAAIGEVSAEGVLQVQWRLSEGVAAMQFRAEDNALFVTLPESGSVLYLQPGKPAQRRLATVPRGSGKLGGIAFDDEGGVWVALYDGWSVLRITTDGHLDRIVGLPVPCPTDIVFLNEGGRRQLLVTTSRHSTPLDALASAPMSGKLLMVNL